MYQYALFMMILVKFSIQLKRGSPKYIGKLGSFLHDFVGLNPYDKHAARYKQRAATKLSCFVFKLTSCNRTTSEKNVRFVS